MDNGPGIDPELLPSIFDPSVSTKSDSGEGLGLGLALSRRIVEEHGGTLTAQNNPSGEGSRLVVELPIRETA